MRKMLKMCAGALLLLVGTGAAHADGGVTFTNIAKNGGAGIAYHRVASPDRLAEHIAQTQQVWPAATWPAAAQMASPQKWHGAPGIAVFDYDNDGDLDIYVTNGPGQSNSLYKNMLMETGHVSFVDVAAQAHVQLKNHDSSGVCFGDIDNDGFEDLYVLGSHYSNHLFHNNGDGTFTDITDQAGVGGDPTWYYSGCSMGDVNNDGFLDIAVGTTYDWHDRKPVFVPGYIPGTEPNYLFINNGNNTFTDASESSGIRNLLGDAVPNGQSVTWAIALVDIDQDGDLDIMQAEDAGPGDHGRGYLRLLKNDGTGHFTDETFNLGLKVPGGFMGFAYGDLNCDGTLDFFVTDTGSYLTPLRPSRWYLQNADGTFTNPGLGNLKGTPFGWGASPLDYDNDGDVDIYYDGKVDMVWYLMGDNPGTLLTNTGNCSATMAYDDKAILEDHRPRMVEGVAVGDLNNDGFDDILTVSELNITPVNWFQFTVFAVPVPRSPIFDPIAYFELGYNHTPAGYVWLDPEISDGDLSIEINSANNGNKSAQITLKGGKGLTAGGKVNRDGIGGVIHFTPDGGKTVIRAVLGGSSYASEDSLRTTFGLGKTPKGTADVLWTGGLHNRFYDIKAGESLTVPEIPCDFTDWTDNLGPHASRHDHRDQYQQCVQTALTDYNNKGLINKKLEGRLLASALRAFDEQTNHH